MATGVLDLLVNLAVEHRPRHGLIVGVERGFGFDSSVVHVASTS